MKKTNMPALKHYAEEHSAALHAFQLPKEKALFTTLPKEFNEAIEGQYRIVIVNGNEPVGFFILHATERVAEYTDQAQAMLFTSLSINQVEQGKGYAKQAMLLLKQFMESEFPYCREIVLAVNQKNIAAQQLYEKVGFQDTGKRKQGPIGEQRIMHLLLQQVLD